MRAITRRMVTAGGLVAGIVLATAAFGWQTQAPEKPALSPEDRDRVIDSVGRAVEKHYVFPDAARRVSEEIRARQSKGKYAEVATGTGLADLLSSELRSIAQDKHFELRYSARVLPNPLPEVGQSAADQKLFRFQNHGF